MAHRSKRPYKLPEPMTCDAAKTENGISFDLVEYYVRKHQECMIRYKYLEALYRGFHDVFREPEKEDWKPDNRLAVNFPRYITETFIGYGYGVPISETHPDEEVNDAIQTFRDDNEITDHEAELIKQCCIYGHSFEYIYQNEEKKTKVSECTPIEMFVVYDDEMDERALFAVRYAYHSMESEQRGKMYGEILTREEIRHFDGGDTKEVIKNPYGYIPVVEWRLNNERMGLYESVAGLIEAYNHAIGEKANDVDAFADAYLAILGAKLDEDQVYRIRDDRLINIFGTDNAKDVIVQFLQKPTADGTQENLLNRLENLIYQTSMVANISDETFGNATSGVSLAYKLQAMSNLALTFDRKIEKSLKKRYKIFCSLKNNVSNPDAWREVVIKATRNIPKNLQEEAATASQLEGIVSKETQLSVLSIIDDPQEELKKIDEENEEEREKNSVYPATFGRQNTGQANEAGAEEQKEIRENENS